MKLKFRNHKIEFLENKKETTEEFNEDEYFNGVPF